ncbi:hypothetical protein BD413DRAFT_494302 [Trametes elegans]|nr:hypothetical protein BD413DRAFT_494302 [Trametes elegans]
MSASKELPTVTKLVVLSTGNKVYTESHHLGTTTPSAVFLCLHDLGGSTQSFSALSRLLLAHFPRSHVLGLRSKSPTIHNFMADLGALINAEVSTGPIVLVAHGIGLYTTKDESLAQLTGSTSMQRRPDAVALVCAAMLKQNSAAFGAQIRALDAQSRSGALAIVGDKDVLTPPGAVMRFLNPRSAWTLPKVGHYPSIDTPVGIAELISSFAKVPIHQA